MGAKNDPFGVLRTLDGDGPAGQYYSLPALKDAGVADVSRLPVSIRIVLESVLRNCDGEKITKEHVQALANWQPQGRRTAEIPFVVSRILLQDFTGVPLLCDLAAMRGAAARAGIDPALIEPLVPVDLVIDHSVQVDYHGAPGVMQKNMNVEFYRNHERYKFLKWGMEAFHTFKVIPPGIGIVHQVNLEYLARGIHRRDGVCFPDTLVGTDSHTTMINGIGVVGWGVGGIEAEAGMLGQPVYFLTPDVVGVNLTGSLPSGVTTTDLVLSITEMLRAQRVVSCFVEFFGEGAAMLSTADRATIANMSPEYGATMGFFAVDDETLRYFSTTGRTAQETADLEQYMKAQGLFGTPREGDIDYTRTISFDLSTVEPSVAGPKRPQDRIALRDFSRTFARTYSAPVKEGGFGHQAGDLKKRYAAGKGVSIASGDVIIAAITSCTNTSNPDVLLAAGLLAKKAVMRGLSVRPHIKTSLAPGSRVVTDYLNKAGLLQWLEHLGFYVSAYGCTTCIGNAGKLDAELERAIVENDLICTAVLSGNRNFEARIHANIRGNFLMSPPLVVACAIAGTVLTDMSTEPLGKDSRGNPVYLHEIWPSDAEVQAARRFADDPEIYRQRYRDLTGDNHLWTDLKAAASVLYDWPESTYIAEPPFFNNFTREPKPLQNIIDARALGIFGDTVTTDHISPAGPIREDSSAGQYLLSVGVQGKDFQSFGTRRGNHEVMIRGTFANVRIRNLMLPPAEDGQQQEGGYTLHQPSGERMFIYDAAMRYLSDAVPSVVFGGQDYGTGSSRDWAAKGTQLLGVRAVVARSFERIHRANLAGMGVLPLQFREGESVQTHGIRGDERFTIEGLSEIKPMGEVTLRVVDAEGRAREVELTCRLDTPIEVEYFRHGGILSFVLSALVRGNSPD